MFLVKLSPQEMTMYFLLGTFNIPFAQRKEEENIF